MLALDYFEVQNLGRQHSQSTTGNYMLLLSAWQHLSRLQKSSWMWHQKKSHENTQVQKSSHFFTKKSLWRCSTKPSYMRVSRHRNPFQHSDQTVTSDKENPVYGTFGTSDHFWQCPAWMDSCKFQLDCVGCSLTPHLGSETTAESQDTVVLWGILRKPPLYSLIKYGQHDSHCSEVLRLGGWRRMRHYLYTVWL